MPAPVKVEPGEFPPEMLDQREWWAYPSGDVIHLREMDEDRCLRALDLAMASASRMRLAWAKPPERTYDPEQRARRWILDRVAIRALMQRLMELEWERKEREYIEAMDHPRYRLRPADERAIEAALEKGFKK